MVFKGAEVDPMDPSQHNTGFGGRLIACCCDASSREIMDVEEPVVWPRRINALVMVVALNTDANASVATVRHTPL